jgi:hypothetical protein
MSLVADEIASMASSAASMDRKAIETRVIELETQLMLTANQQKRTKAANLVRSSMIRFFGRHRTSSRRSTPWTCIVCGGWNRL